MGLALKHNVLFNHAEGFALIKSHLKLHFLTRSKKIIFIYSFIYSFLTGLSTVLGDPSGCRSSDTNFPIKRANVSQKTEQLRKRFIFESQAVNELKQFAEKLPSIVAPQDFSRTSLSVA